MGSYRLSKRADTDLIEVFVFGIEQFGLSQAETYQNQLAHCFERLADNPRLGRKADTIGEGVRRHESGSHVVLYEEEQGGVLILALVHKSSVLRLKI